MKTIPRKKNQKKQPNRFSFESFRTIILFLTVFFLPSQLGKHFFFPFSYISGIRIDYLAITFYLTDIFIFLLALFYIKEIGLFLKKHLLFAGILLLPVFFASSLPLAFFHYIKIWELFVLFCVFQQQKNNTSLFYALLAGCLFEGILVVLQLINQHSLQGIWYLWGERYFRTTTPGIAKIGFFGKELLRPYGTFSHPNSMGGFFLLLYVFILTEPKIKNPVFKNIMIFLCTFLIFFSFSKNAILVYVCITVFYSLFSKPFCKLCTVAKIISIGILAFIFLQTQGDLLSFQKRIEVFQDSLAIIVAHPLFGVGWGNYLIAQSSFPIKYPYFFLQPVHNIVLYLISEGGILTGGFVLYSLGNWVKQNRKNIRFILLFAIVFLTGMGDHYWITLQQNWLLMGVVFGLANYKDK